MSNNYDEYEYDDSSYSRKRNNYDFLEKIGVFLLIISAIIIILMLVKSCTNKNNSSKNNNVIPNEEIKIDYDSALLSAGKRYFENNRDEYPEAPGECAQVTLQTLIINGLLSSENWKTCNSVNTYVRVCMLENRTVQYTPWFAYNDKVSSNEYYDSVEGTLNSIVADSSYVDFIFLPQELQKTNIFSRLLLNGIQSMNN